MNQRGAVKAVSITSILGVVIALLFLPSFGGFVGAADDGSECGLPGAIAINAELWNPKKNASKPDKTIDLALPIEAGTYTVKLVPFDDHSIFDPEQTEEPGNGVDPQVGVDL